MSNISNLGDVFPWVYRAAKNFGSDAISRVGSFGGKIAQWLQPGVAVRHDFVRVAKVLDVKAPPGTSFAIEASTKDFLKAKKVKKPAGNIVEADLPVAISFNPELHSDRIKETVSTIVDAVNKHFYSKADGRTRYYVSCVSEKEWTTSIQYNFAEVFSKNCLDQYRTIPEMVSENVYMDFDSDGFKESCIETAERLNEFYPLSTYV